MTSSRDRRRREIEDDDQTRENDRQTRLILRQLRHDLTTIMVLLSFGMGFFVDTVLYAFGASSGVRSLVLLGCLASLGAALYRRRPRE